MQNFIFEHSDSNSETSLFDSTLVIAADPFLEAEDFRNYLLFKENSDTIKKATKEKTSLNINFVESSLKQNPDYFVGYELVGHYYATAGEPETAVKFYKVSLTKETE